MVAKRSSRLWIPILVSILSLGLVLTPVHATSGGASPGVLAARPSTDPQRPGAGVLGASLPLVSGSHYLYADDGLFSNNSLDEYKASASGLTHIGTVPTGSFTKDVPQGQNDIAIARANSSHGRCLVHSDSGGAVESFTINATTGVLTMVSSVPEGNGSTTFPGDTKVSSDGKDAYVSVWPINSSSSGSLVTLPLGAGCALGAPVTLALTGGQTYYSIALPDATHLLAVDFTNSKLDIYTITGGTVLQLETSTPTQFSFPEGGAAGTVSGTTYTFNGQDVFGVPQAEANTFTSSNGALGPVPGSPQTDGNPSASNGANVYLAAAYALLTQTNQISNTVAAYSISGGTLAYKNTAALDPTSNGPLSQTSLSHYLAVLSYQSGTISACQLATTGVSSCVLEATVTGGGSGGSVPGGIAVF